MLIGDDVFCPLSLLFWSFVLRSSFVVSLLVVRFDFLWPKLVVVISPGSFDPEVSRVPTVTGL
jgi:hypothetical protein